MFSAMLRPSYRSLGIGIRALRATPRVFPASAYSVAGLHTSIRLSNKSPGNKPEEKDASDEDLDKIKREVERYIKEAKNDETGTWEQRKKRIDEGIKRLEETLARQQAREDNVTEEENTKNVKPGSPPEDHPFKFEEKQAFEQNKRLNDKKKADEEKLSKALNDPNAKVLACLLYTSRCV